MTKNLRKNQDLKKTYFLINNNSNSNFNSNCSYKKNSNNNSSSNKNKMIHFLKRNTFYKVML